MAEAADGNVRRSGRAWSTQLTDFTLETFDDLGASFSDAASESIMCITEYFGYKERSKEAKDVVVQQTGEQVYRLVPVGMRTPDCLPTVLLEHDIAIVQALARGRAVRRRVDKKTRDRWTAVLSQVRYALHIEGGAKRRSPMSRLRYYIHRAVSNFLDSDDVLSLLSPEVREERLRQRREFQQQRTLLGEMTHLWRHEDAGKILTRLRGTEGETILHLCFLQVHEPLHKVLAKMLVELYPALIDCCYQGARYRGETCLHMAIVKKDRDMFNFLLSRNARVDIPVTGDFFMPNEVFDLPIRDAVSSGLRYWGQYPLHFAAATGELEMVTALINYATVQKALKSVLHTLVMCGSKFPLDAIGNSMNPEDREHISAESWAEMMANEKLFFMMYQLLVDRGANEGIDPDGEDMVWSGMSPFVLAAKLARKRMFFTLLERRKRKYWDFGPVVCFGYPLADLDTIELDGSLNRTSALQVIVDRALDSEKHLSMIDGMLLRLLKFKWMHTRKYFYASVLIHLVYLSLATAVILLRPSSESWDVGDDHHRGLMELILLLITIIMTVEEMMQLKDIWHLYTVEREHWVTCISQYLAGTGILSLFRWGAIVCFYGAAVMRLAESDHEREYVALFAWFVWGYTLYLFRTVPYVGPLVIMICQILHRNVVPFLVLYVVLTLGVSLGFYALFHGSNIEYFETFRGTLLTLFRNVFTWEVEYEVYDTSAHPEIARLFYVLYISLFAIILLNILIAMMNSTYISIRKRSNREVLREKAKIIMMLESAYIFKLARLKIFRHYAQPWPPGSEVAPLPAAAHSWWSAMLHSAGEYISKFWSERKERWSSMKLLKKPLLENTLTDQEVAQLETEWMMLIEEEVPAHRMDTLRHMDESEVAAMFKHSVRAKQKRRSKLVAHPKHASFDEGSGVHLGLIYEDRPSNFLGEVSQDELEVRRAEGLND